jgi:hypothetical protein
MPPICRLQCHSVLGCRFRIREKKILSGTASKSLAESGNANENRFFKQYASRPSVLRIRDVYPRSDFFSIPDPNFFHPVSRILIKEFKYLTPKKLFLSSRKYDPGCSFQIRIPDPQRCRPLYFSVLKIATCHTLARQYLQLFIMYTVFAAFYQLILGKSGMLIYVCLRCSGWRVHCTGAHRGDRPQSCDASPAHRKGQLQAKITRTGYTIQRRNTFRKHWLRIRILFQADQDPDPSLFQI